MVGDKSSGKTLLMIEACANFAKLHSDGGIYYRETEAAFQQSYAKALGMPIDRVDFGKDKLDTVEDLFEDLHYHIRKAKEQSLYIVDSLDALSDRAEQERDIDEDSYGTAKAKKMSELFRRLGREFDPMTILIVSQVRSKLGVTFGPKIPALAGAPWISMLRKFSCSASGERSSRPYRKRSAQSVSISTARSPRTRYRCRFREADFPILFGFGIDDMMSCLEWLATD